MVKITKIYTKTGDGGQTGLGTNERVSKASVRVQAYGDVDEANGCIGVAAAIAVRDGMKEIAPVLESVQQDMFDVGADLCAPASAGDGRLRISPAQTARLEELIDAHNADLGTLTSFVLPGGSECSAALHVARCVVRRAERSCVVLREHELEETSVEALRYLNRLSDLLFVLARVANDHGRNDVLWKPGVNRGEGSATQT